MNHQSPLVSVVIPIYNVQDFLEQCLASVVHQSYPNLEILCVIDGSQDDSENIARGFAEIDSRCHILTQPNQGLSVARNTGITAATGEWVFFLDSDDWLAENAIKNLVATALRTQLPIISGAVIEYWEDAGTIKPYQKPHKRLVGAVDLRRQDFFALETMVWNKLYSRNLVVHYPFAPGLIHEDLDFYWRIFSQHSKTYAIPDNVVYYRRRSGSLSQQKSHDEHYQDNYIHILDNAFLVTQNYQPLRYHVFRQSLKYLKYLKKKNAPCARYERHILERYGVKNTAGFRLVLRLRRLFGMF